MTEPVASYKIRIANMLLQVAEDPAQNINIRLRAAKQLQELLQPPRPKREEQHKLPPKRPRRKKDVLGLRSI